MLGIQINGQDVKNEKIYNLIPKLEKIRGTNEMTVAFPFAVNSITNNEKSAAETISGSYLWHIPRPSLLLACKPENDHDKSSWIHHLHPYSSSRGSTYSQGSKASTRSTASGTMLLTAANLSSLAAAHPPIVTAINKSIDTASVASSTHFTVVNGIGKPATTTKKSWCARNQLTVLVSTMSLLFMIALLLGVLYMEVRAREKYH
ncbi:uncharacterized protein [Venturia canescens]|uniref:uncharacterized protein isoform X2 n=1 Tax=Venturia canescens TaxID=32260 RepID=UPI001C9CBE65|nr:uncharacterized protein LOC122409472 isoform X2 [Venturia canescens]